jgi:putative resolvase
MATYSLAEFARLIGVSTRTLQRWDYMGRLVADRTPTNRRQYTDKHLTQVRGAGKQRPRRQSVVYCRVSSAGQKADLAKQRQMLEQFCAARGLAVDEWVEEIGGGLNFKRKRFLNIVDRIGVGAIETLVIAHKDRLARFGYGLIEHLCEIAACQLVVMNTETLSSEREMVEDLMSIVQCFSSRLYGLGNYRKALAKALSDDASA